MDREATGKERGKTRPKRAVFIITEVEMLGIQAQTKEKVGRTKGAKG